MGDQPYGEIILPKSFTEDDRDAIASQFSEALRVLRVDVR